MIGRKLAHYEIKAVIGKGGMGEVFRARDTKLERDVALKVLPHELSGDPERKARFQREARSLASLQHPNVASIYGFEDVDGVRFLVMELVEGEDLSQRLAKGSVTVEEARAYAAQIAAGLEAAHESGLVHRDLKPANIMVNPEGGVKILDFGLARAWYGDTVEDQDLAMSPTITAAMTQAGTILGTAAYMSPEQARGRNVDRRADIWAFGVILYEMLTGRKLFEGDTVSDTLAAVLRAEPEWSDLPADEAPELCHLIERCLQRDPKLRLRDIGEARILLQPGGASASTIHRMQPAAIDAPAKKPWRLMALIGLVTLAVGLLAGRMLQADPPAPPVLHAMIPPPPETNIDSNSSAPAIVAVSPDGSMMVFGARASSASSQLYLRQFDRGESTALPGTEGAAYPFWSPDSRYVGFFQDDKLRKIAVQGGPPTTLCPASNGKGGSWNAEGTILFAPSHDSGLFRVPDTGGDPQQVTELGEGEDSHRHPRFLPDGNGFLYISRTPGGGVSEDVMQATLDGGEARRITESESQAEFSQGHLFTVREDILVATPFDPDSEALPVGGTPVVENQLVLSRGSVAASFSVSPTGLIVYQTGESGGERYLYRVDTDTGASEVIGEPGLIRFPRISPDGNQAVVEIGDDSETTTDLWIADLRTGLRTRFTFDPGNESQSVWAPDGQSVYYTQESDSTWTIVRRPVEGTGVEEILYRSKTTLYASGISPDGGTLLLTDAANNGDVAKLDTSGPGAPVPFLDTDAMETVAVWSPDGEWIAYLGNYNGQGFRIFVVPAEGGGRKWQVTTTSSVWPQWSPDGREIWYSIFEEPNVWSTSVQGAGGTFRIGDARARGKSGAPEFAGPGFTLGPDGVQILTSDERLGEREDISLFHVVTDWQRGLVR